VILIAVIGISFIITPHVIAEKYITENLEIGLTLLGGGTVIFAHWKNRVYCIACQKKPLSCFNNCNECKMRV